MVEEIDFSEMTRNLQVISGQSHTVFAMCRFCGFISKAYNYLLSYDLTLFMNYSNTGSVVCIVYRDWVLKSRFAS